MYVYIGKPLGTQGWMKNEIEHKNALNICRIPCDEGPMPS